MGKKPKKILLLSLILVFLGGLLWTGFLKYSLKRLKNDVAFAEVALKARGIEVDYAALEIRGTPFALEVSVHSPHLKILQQSFEWKGDEMMLRMRPWNWNHIMYTLKGEQHVSLHTEVLSFKTATLEGAHGALTLGPQRNLDQLSLQIDRVKFFREVELPIFLSAFTLTLKDISHPLGLQMSTTTTLEGLDSFLGNPPSSHPVIFSLDAQLSGFQGKNPFPQSLADWRDGGGVMDINMIQLAWSPLNISGEGTLTFDQAMYPLGAFSSRITGYQKGLDHLVKAGFVKEKAAAMAMLVLDLISRPGKEGEKEISVPITLQDRRISVGSVPLIKMR